jgi:hypothetical protein
MTNPRTVEECKKMLFKLAIKHGVAPKLISERLLSREDKEDMLQGLVTFETLNCAVEVWKEQGMRNYADGSGAVYSDFRFYLPKGTGK